MPIESERPAGREVGEPYPWSGLQAARWGCQDEGGVIKLSLWLSTMSS